LGLIAINVAVNHWFRRRSSSAIGIAAMGLAVSGALVVPGIVALQAAAGWRTAAAASAIGVLVIGVPAALLGQTSLGIVAGGVGGPLIAMLVPVSPAEPTPAHIDEPAIP